MGKILFVQRAPVLNIGTMMLSAVLKMAGHESEVTIANRGKRLAGRIAARGADLVGFHCVAGSERWIAGVLGGLSRRPPVVLGGPHPTFVPELISGLPADYLIRGEGEGALADLMGLLREPQSVRTAVPNLCTLENGNLRVNPLRPLIDPLDSLPFQDPALYFRMPFMRRFASEYYPTITSRGCPFNCTFCFNDRFRELYRVKGRQVRRRSPGHVAEEIERAKRDYGITRIVFEDDAFGADARWLEEFAEAHLRGAALPFTCQTTASLLNEKTAPLLARMKCRAVRFGIETADERNRREILGKNVTNRDIVRAAGLLRKSGIMLQTYNMLGAPGEGVPHAMETLRLNRAIRSDFAWSSFFHPYPGTRIYEKHCAAGGVPPPVKKHDSFFVPDTPVRRNRRLVNLGFLFQAATATRAPDALVGFLAALPLTALYKFVFKVFYALALRKINCFSLPVFLNISVRSARNF
ncbi:MAG: radical SAM protein [bacterium]